MSADEEPELADVMDFDVDHDRDDERRWLVLYPEDYDNAAIDPEGNVGLLLDDRQAGEVLRIASEVLASLSHKDAEGDDVIRDMIEGLEEVLDE